MQKRAKAMTTLRSNACVDVCTEMDFESRATHTVKLWSCPPTHMSFLVMNHAMGLGRSKTRVSQPTGHSAQQRRDGVSSPYII